MIMMTADKSKDETPPVDEVVRAWKMAIASFAMPCILVFNNTTFLQDLMRC